MIPRRYLVRIAPWWVLLVLIGSFLPSSSKEALGTINSAQSHGGWQASSNHRFAHFLVFGSTALLFLLLAESRAQQIRAAAGVALFGLAIEWTQYQFLGLDGIEWWDIRDDALAALVMLLLDKRMNLRSFLLARDAGQPSA